MELYKQRTGGSSVGMDYPLGATPVGGGCHFAVFSEHATRIELCLYSANALYSEIARHDLSGPMNGVWSTFLSGVREGQSYGFRVHGPYAPREGHRFNPRKLLMDPYARALCGELTYDDAVYGYPRGGNDETSDDQDSAPFVPRSVVCDDSFDWGNDSPPRTPWEDTVIYECHVKGLTKLHPEVPAEQRGMYLGLTAEPVIDHLRQLGVTAVELLPGHEFVDERPLVEHGLVNYWGYNPIAWFAPTRRYATAPDRAACEFKAMVRALHAAGIEVILDVVYNHTAESDELGPTLSLRGLDNASYYELEPNDRRRYVNAAGCGNTLNIGHPRVLQLVMDNLRFWVNEMHVDGFRFDLTTALTRDHHSDVSRASLITAIAQDPVLAHVKLIAEPWDATANRYRLGGFPGRWSEWNDKYRSTVCRFWRGDAVTRGDLCQRLAGSSDVFGSGRRGPRGSINCVSAHDGFTLRDLVTYDRKYNEVNGQRNEDGDNSGLSRNWGTEGPTDDKGIMATRDRIVRNMLATLALSLGVPMIVAGDEMGRTQLGNNNGYCQDNELSWVDWQLDARQRSLLTFSRNLFALRRAIRILHRSGYLSGAVVCHHGLKDVAWLDRYGKELAGDAWQDARDRLLGVLLHACNGVDADRPAASNETILMLYNGEETECAFSFSECAFDLRWNVLLDTTHSDGRAEQSWSDRVVVGASSVVVLVAEKPNA